MSKAIVYLALALIVLSILAFLLGMTLGAVMWLIYIGFILLILMIVFKLVYDSSSDE